jgi:hypothetical protein
MAQPRPLFREGFHLKENNFALPEQTLLDPRTKRDLTICNLFVNHHMSIPNIQHLLDEDPGKIVHTLIDRRILEDRRQMNLRAPEGINRRRAPHKVQVVEKPRWSQKHTHDLFDEWS